MELIPDILDAFPAVLPDDWKVLNLSDVASLKSGESITAERMRDSAIFPCYGGNGLRGYTDRFTHDGRYALVGRQGALCGNVIGVSGKFFASEHAIVVTPRPKTDIEWLTFVLDRMNLNQYSESSAQPGLSIEKIGRLKVAIPPTKTEQNAIAEALSDAAAYVESLEQLIAKKRLVKQGAMQELLTGKRRLSGFEGEPGTKKTVIGLAPVDWSVISFGDLFHFSGGYSASREELSFDGHYYLHYGDIHTSNATFIDLDAPRFHIPKLNVHIKMVSANSLLSDGDVVFVDASEDEDGASKHVVVVNSRRLPFISGLHTIVAKQKSPLLDHMFLRYCFKSPAVKSQFRFYAVGTKVLGVSKGNIVNIMMAVPPLKEQAAIGIMLSDMDAEIDQLQATLDKARDIKQGMMQNLLTGRIRLV